MKRTLTRLLGISAAMLAMGSTSSAQLDDGLKTCNAEVEAAYESSYGALEMLDSLGRAELCLADANDLIVANNDSSVRVDEFRNRYGDLCSLLADSIESDGAALGRIYTLQCRVEAERGLGAMIGAYTATRRAERPSVTVWDEHPEAKPLAKLHAVRRLDEDLNNASVAVVEHFIASLQGSHPEQHPNKIKSRVIQTLTSVEHAQKEICDDLSRASGQESVCTDDMLTLTSALIYRYSDFM